MTFTEIYPRSPSPTKPQSPRELPSFSPSNFRHPDRYLPEPGLVDAVNVALTLRQPLMLTGEPGTGKTVLAWSIAWELGLEPPLVFETKSTSQARDLFYFYDTLGRFTAKELGTDIVSAKEYLTYNALGSAIILTKRIEFVRELLPSSFEYKGPQRSVVLIDEVEKAPRDFANDILNEIERMYFRIPELGNRLVQADESLSPVIVMTNNSEKSLPDAFLRRCIYYNISFPSGPRLEEIIMRQLPEFIINRQACLLLKDVVAFSLQVRDEATGLEKKPGTAELLSWLSVMSKLGANAQKPLRAQKHIARRALPAFIKISGDTYRVEDMLMGWTK